MCINKIHCVIRWIVRINPVDSAIHQAPVVQKVGSAIHRINHYPVDSTVGFANAYRLDSDLSGPGCSKGE